MFKRVVMNICSIFSLVIGFIAGSVFLCSIFKSHEGFIIIVNNLLSINPQNALFIFVVGVGIGLPLRIVIEIGD